MDRGRSCLCGAAALVFLEALGCFATLAGAQGGVGVNYGTKGDNLPTADKVVNLFKSRNIQFLRLFDPNPDALNALHGSGISVVLGTLNQDLQQLAGSQDAAAQWVAAHVTPHANAVKFRYISAGNEVIPGDLASFVLPAMQNLDAALKAAGTPVPVTTSIATTVLGVSYPPSQGSFSSDTAGLITPILGFLAANGTPLLVNVYPYFAIASDPANIRLDYALFTATGTVVQDGALAYNNLFDAVVDATYAAIERAGQPGVKIVVSETGWPSGGNGDLTTPANAATYNNNAVKHAVSGNGTPRRPGGGIEVYLFAIFNEDQKPGGVEQHFGLYNPDITEVYHVDFP
ncbi:hypothetical protein Taro_046852 [Colocasia esculenta]|uniref:Beta-1,3-glucanase n=1 Tax=Colocasia esculenta TaxID=4460 RepID=A0A843WZX7_COLES|nr:hypothetical protein [Colocasia esculenta]